MSAEPTFYHDIRPLFSQYERIMMMFYCDFWNYEQVKARAESIHLSLQPAEAPPNPGGWSKLSEVHVMPVGVGPWPQEKIEEIIGDKKNPSKGFDWVTTSGRYSSDVPAVGFSRSVIITTGNVQNGVSYAYIQVKVTHSEISDIKLETWLTDY